MSVEKPEGLERGFRPAAPRSNVLNVIFTAMQASILWAFFLVAVPLFCIWLEERLQIAPYRFVGQWGVAFVLFCFAALLNLWSAFVMAWFGKGTPFPLDTARELVVRGPYRFVRNPMVLCGLSLGFASAILLGSWFASALPVMGGIVWHFVARPPEEVDLQRRFGTSYLEYRDNVRNWLPRFRPYSAKKS